MADDGSRGRTPELTLAHSPDSDDVVMWWPVGGMCDARGRRLDGERGEAAIGTGGFRFRCVSEDIQALNRRAIAAAEGRAEGYDVTALSAYTYPFVRGVYAITSCGGSFGEGYGPKVVVAGGSPVQALADLRGARIAVPGTRTTAFLVLSLLLGSAGGSAAFSADEMVFSEVVGAVREGRADAGLLIHEAQLTFAGEGLRAVADLGAVWGESTGLPLPLGLNAVRRDLDERFGAGSCARVSGVLGASVRHAVEAREASREYLRLRSGDRPEWRDDALVERYLRMYVSPLTVSMGERGRRALAELLGRGAAAGLCPYPGAVDVLEG